MIVSDAWFPQTNGVVNTLAQTAAWLGRFGHEVRLSAPRDFRTVPCPTYPEIRVAILPQRKLASAIVAFRPQALHIATEGPLGFSARRYCLSRGLRFTTSYHTQFPQYLRSRLPIPLALSYALLRWFHGAAQSCMISTPGVQSQLAARGFSNLVRWRRGVDTQLFRPRSKDFLNLSLIHIWGSYAATPAHWALVRHKDSCNSASCASAEAGWGTWLSSK